MWCGSVGGSSERPWPCRGSDGGKADRSLAATSGSEEKSGVSKDGDGEVAGRSAIVVAVAVTATAVIGGMADLDACEVCEHCIA